jgi:hypothetical protein
VELVSEQVEAEAVYELERAVRCPSCNSTVRTLNVIRSLRTRVNFTSNLPRRGYAILCPDCNTILSANIGSRVL